MFRCELRYDEKKIEQTDYSIEEVHAIVDRIFRDEGVPKVADGIYEDPDAKDSWHTLAVSFKFWNCPVIVHFCNYLHVIDPEEGDYGDCSYMLKERQSWVLL